MPKMVLTKDCDVNGKQQRAGHEFDASEKEARLWASLGRAVHAGGEQTGRLNLVGEKANDQAETRRPRQGRYNRRDMRA